LKQLEQAAVDLFAAGRPAAEQSPLQSLALQLVMRLADAFRGPHDVELAARLHAAMAALELDRGPLVERREAAVRAVARWAPASQAADDRNRPWVLKQLVYALSLLDPAFGEVNTEGLADKLASYRPGDGSAERILAEIICEDCNALGLASDPAKTELEDVERIRLELVNSVTSL
jgi:hypothetical protein